MSHDTFVLLVGAFSLLGLGLALAAAIVADQERERR
jgi:hypothetical protein